MRKDPWTDPDPQPGDFDAEIDRARSDQIEIREGSPDAKLSIIVSVEGDDAKCLERIATERGQQPGEVVSQLLRSAWTPQRPWNSFRSCDFRFPTWTVQIRSPSPVDRLDYVEPGFKRFSADRVPLGRLRSVGHVAPFVAPGPLETHCPSTLRHGQQAG